ncbi:outer membrane protein [Flavobacterium piscisymbiosum]|uniref:Porin family protein n=1 Tax=Flavobacterium piscisymbiosum TaxID=2893753 RepID=A0ABS8M7S0_9FLAO|nr:porin family protein [Flavobacterium sp. F-30]MCC9061542.1 porin family protein [Flavobacterium sp. F-30]
MKKIILSAIAVMAFGFANAQEGHFKVGAHTGFILGDLKDSYSVNLGVDAAYLWNVADKFSVGATTGYTTYLSKKTTVDTPFGSFEIEGDNAGFIPVAATAQYSLTDNLFVGADLGYAIYVGSGEGDGGVLYQPKFGYQNEKIEIFASYKGISDDLTLSSINLGFNYKF